MTFVDLRPGRVRTVQVFVDDTWWDGDLEAYDRQDGVWSGYVRWSEGVGQTRLGWFTQDQIRGAAPSPRGAPCGAPSHPT